MENFKQIKEEIINRARKSNACDVEFKKAFKAENIKYLLMVVKDNFNYCCVNKIIDCKILEAIGKEVCEENNIFYNVSARKGFLFVDSATVTAYDSVNVIAYGSATVIAYNSATVTAYDSVYIEAYDSVNVIAYGSVYIEAYDSVYIDSRNSIEHKISDKATIRYYYNNRIVLAENIAIFTKK